MTARGPARAAASVLVASAFLAAGGCSGRTGLPAPDSRAYRDFVAAFYVGLAGLETGEDVRAKEKLTRASEIAPGEPATWANLALFSARQQDFELAYTNAEKARGLAPDNSRIEALVGAVESRRGHLPEALTHWRRAVTLDSKNLKARYALAEETGRLGTPAADGESQNEFQKLLDAGPDNTAVRLEVMRLAAKRGDAGTLRAGIARLETTAAAWPPEARERLTALRETAGGASLPAAAVQVAFLRNVLARDPAYRQSLNAVKTPAAFVGEPFSHFLKLPTPSSSPAAPDTGLRFTSQLPVGVAGNDVVWAGAIPLNDSGEYSLVTADAQSIQVAGGARVASPGGQPVGRNGVLGADLNYDFKTDLVIANAAGVRLYQQRDSGSFADLTPTSKLPPAIANGEYSGAWAFDVDLDGDLDIVLGTPAGDPPVLRNNGDGTFAVVRPFTGVAGLRSFAAADIDGDGDPDVALVDAHGGLHVFANERLGMYRRRALPPALGTDFVAVAAGDINGDGMPDLVVLRSNGSVVRLSDKDGGAAWDVAELVPPGGAHLNPATANLLLADLDNNGSLDLVAGDGRAFLNGSRGLTPASIATGVTITGAADLNGDGRLDLIGFNGKPVELVNHGTRNYNWQRVRVRAAQAVGDQRINSFGIGGEVEVRSGLLTQKQVIASPVLHFGLGENRGIDVARIVWPNGSVQAEFELAADRSVLAQQRLKGSCPFLFAWNGKEMRFVKDAQPWSPALGLHINAQAVAGIARTEEWFKIPGDALTPREGYYDLRVTAELWESYYIDHYSLLTVDHPANTEIFTDERFSVPPPELKIYAVATPRPFAAAIDDRGTDVSALVESTDGRYLDTFGRGRYQGVTREHWVQLELPEAAPRTGKLYLIASGWMHPTDGTVNVALGQSSDPPPHGLRLEVADLRGNWVVRKELGFLAGRNKTAVIDLTGVFNAKSPRKLRLRTNLEIYWDRLAWAQGLADSTARVQPSALLKADLVYRGFSEIGVANASSPEIPDYNRLEGSAQKWRDLEGYYTRFGDVRELLDRIDDRIVITNAGDELRLRFAAAQPPAAGWKRDYVMVGDGWIKDGDYNSTFSKTVLPLPYHAMKDYTAAPTTLERDPAYRLHPDDWQQYHTRYVTPERFLRALRN